MTMTKIVTVVEGEESEQEIETKKLTVILHPDDMEVRVPSHVSITAEDTVARAKQVSVGEWEELKNSEHFIKLWKMVFPENNPPTNLQIAPIAQRHIVGMLIMIFEAMAAGKNPFVQLPETYLHPKAQLGLGSLFSYLSKGGEDGNSQSASY